MVAVFITSFMLSSWFSSFHFGFVKTMGNAAAAKKNDPENGKYVT